MKPNVEGFVLAAQRAQNAAIEFGHDESVRQAIARQAILNMRSEVNSMQRILASMQRVSAHKQNGTEPQPHEIET